MATWSDAAATVRLARRCATGSCLSPRRRRGQRDFRAGDCGGCGAIFGSLLRNSMRDDRDRAWRSGGARQFWNRRCDADEGAARGEGRDGIAVPSGVRILVATKPVDFRRGADSLAALAKDDGKPIVATFVHHARAAVGPVRQGEGRADMSQQHPVLARAATGRTTLPGEVAARADAEALA